MHIPVFVSCPTSLNQEQEEKRKILVQYLDKFNLCPRSLGRSDYPKDYPLKEVLAIAKHCAGAVILGFEQFYHKTGTAKRGIKGKEAALHDVIYPTQWNNLESGIMFALGLPLIIFREDGISGGIFDIGTTDIFIHNMPSLQPNEDESYKLNDIFMRWHTDVINKYYR